MLQLAAIEAYGPGGKPTAIPEAKWRKPPARSIGPPLKI